MDWNIAFIGFGEAGQAFAADGKLLARAFDVQTSSAENRDAKFADYTRCRVDGQETAAEALAGAGAVLCVVTADQAVPAARRYAGLLAPNALWLDMNSVAPQTKLAAAAEIEAAGGRYVDVAVLAPVHPLGRKVPILISGPHVEAAAVMLADSGFTNVRIVSTAIGTASSIKMIRSIMVKGVEALTTEWILAAEAAGVREEAIAALNATWPGVEWSEKADYNLERMMVHGLRRAAEMEEVVKTLDALGTGSDMSRGTIERQRAIGELGLAPPPTIEAKLDVLLPTTTDPAKKDLAA